MELVCKWCIETKPAEQFIRRKAAEPYSQQNVRCCKSCNSKRNRQRYDTIPEVRAKQLAANDLWRREHRDRQNELCDQYHARNPNRQQARNRVNYLIRHGHWTRLPCEVCGTTEGVHAHHDSYAKPHHDIVRWLCSTHHERWHVWMDEKRNEVMEKPLADAVKKRDLVRAKLAEIYRLRTEITALLAAADEQELKAWTKVQALATREFPKYLMKQR